GTWYAVYAVPGFRIVDGALISLYLAQYVAVWGLAVNCIRGRTQLPLTLVAPPLWVAVEYLRCHIGFLSLPWAQLGDSQYESLALLQMASLTGVYGLSFLIVFVNAAMTEAILQGRRASMWLGIPRASLIAASLLIAIFVHGVVVLARRPTPETTRIAVVQGNIPQERKWDAAFRQATLESTARRRGRPPRIDRRSSSGRRRPSPATSGTTPDSAAQSAPLRAKRVPISSSAAPSTRSSPDKSSAASTTTAWCSSVPTGRPAASTARWSSCPGRNIRRFKTGSTGPERSSPRSAASLGVRTILCSPWGRPRSASRFAGRTSSRTSFASSPSAV